MLRLHVAICLVLPLSCVAADVSATAQGDNDPRVLFLMGLGLLLLLSRAIFLTCLYRRLPETKSRPPKTPPSSP